MTELLFIDTDRARVAAGRLRTMGDRGEDTAATIAAATTLASLPESGQTALRALVGTVRMLAGILSDRSDAVDGAGFLGSRRSPPTLDDLTLGGIPIGKVPLDDWFEALDDLARPLGVVGTLMGIAELYAESRDRYDDGSHGDVMTTVLALARTAVGSGAGAVAEAGVCSHGGAAALEIGGPVAAGAVCLVAAPLIGGATQDATLEVWDTVDEHADDIAEALDDVWDWGVETGRGLAADPRGPWWPLEPLYPIIEPAPIIDDLADLFGDQGLGRLFD